MPNKVDIVFEIDKDGKGRAVVKQLDQGIDQLGKTSKSAGSQIEAGLSFVKSAVLVEFFRRGVTEAISFGQAAVKAFNEAQAAALGLQTVAKSAGVDPQAATEAVQNLNLVKNGLLSVGEASTALKNLLRTGFTLDQSLALIQKFGDAAAFNKQSAIAYGEAVVRTTEGIRQNLSTLADAGGITTNLSVIQERAGIKFDDLGNAATRAGAATKYYNEFVKETAPFLGDAEKKAKTFEGQTDALQAAQQRLLVTLGELITKNPELRKALESVSGAIEYLTLQLKDSDSQVSIFANNTVKSIAAIIDAAAKLTKSLGPLLTLLNSFPDVGKALDPGNLVFGQTKDEAQSQALVKTQFNKFRELYVQEQKKLEAQLAQNPITAAATSAQGQKTTDEINKSNEAYFKKTDEANKKFADGIREISKATDDLQAKLSINPVATAFEAADRSRIAFIEKLRDVPKEFRDAFSQASREVQVLDLFKGVLGQSQNLSSLRLQRAQLEAGGDPGKLAQAQRDSIQEQIDAAKKFLDIAQNPAQRQLALARILEATNNTQDLNPEQRDVRFKALNEQISVQEQLFRENFERLKDQTNAQKDNTAALVQVGNRLEQVEGALTNFAQGALTIKIENDAQASVDLGSVNGTTPLQSGSNFSNNN